MDVLIKLPIVASMFKAGTTIAEPDLAQAEIAWVANGTYAVDDLRVDAGVVWSCVLGHTGRATVPAQDGKYWLEERPSNRAAPFDFYISTKALASGSLTYVMQPGFFSDLSMHGLLGDHAEVIVRDAPGGTIVKHVDKALWEQARGLYELLFMPLARRTQLDVDGIPISSTAELTVTVSGAPGAQVGLGYLGIGTWVKLIGLSAFGGTDMGAQAEPKSYAYVKYFDDGTYKYTPRRKAKNLAFGVTFDAEQANHAYSILEEILDQPLPVRASNLPRYGFLNTVGVVSGNVAIPEYGVARSQINVKGFI